MACDAGADEQLLVLLSGGASSLMAAPAKGVTLDDKRQTTARLLRAGADIHALNTVRKHLSAIKGGWLAAASPALAVTTLVISDVVDDDLSVIASGPTVADASTFAEALAVLERFGGRQAYPPSVVDRLAAGADGHLPETPKPGDARLTRSTAKVIGSRFDAMRGADAEAAARGYRTVMLTEPVVGEARQVGPAHTARVLAQLMTMARPVCAISSGETTVTVSGSGRGGRNQELALAVAVSDVLSDKTAALASVGTDGVDGPTDAAGAIVDSSTHERARVAGLDAPDLFLAANNSYAFFAGLGDLIHTGPTGTNVGDLQIFLLA
jgi:hydroxypyruvate reductase